MRFIRDIIAEKRSDHPPKETSQPDGAFGPDESLDIDDFDLISEVEDAEDPAPLLASSFPEERAPNEALTPDPLDLMDFLEDDVKVEAQSEQPPDIPEPGSTDTAEPIPDLAQLNATEQEPVGRASSPHHTPADPSAPNMLVAENPAQSEPASPQPVEVPRPAAGRSAGRTGRVKTRLLGFGEPQDANSNPFQTTEQAAPSTHSNFPVGWLIVVDGPGRGAAFTIHDGVASIGRSPDQAVPLAFGDNSISRENHAAIAYDDEQRSFFLGHGGKANLVRLNGRPVLSTEELRSDDAIRIGETTLRFVALCGAQFSWSQKLASGAGHVAAE